jgi:hypothetical protein
VTSGRAAHLGTVPYMDLIDSVLDKYSEITNITADFCMVIKLHRLITVEYKMLLALLNCAIVKFVEEWAK